MAASGAGSLPTLSEESTSEKASTSSKKSGFHVALASHSAHDRLGLVADANFSALCGRLRTAGDAPRAFCGLDPSEIPEELFFAQRLQKVNRKGQAQQRVLAVSQLCIYNFKLGAYANPQRRIPIFFLDQLVRVKGINDVVLHFWEHSREYDYRWRCESPSGADDMVASISAAYEACTLMTLTVSELSEGELKTLLVLKSDVKLKDKTHSPAADAAVQRRLTAIAKVLAKRYGLPMDSARTSQVSDRSGRSATFFGIFKRGSIAVGGGSNRLLNTGSSSGSGDVDVSAVIGSTGGDIAHSLHSTAKLNALMDTFRSVAKSISTANDSNKVLGALIENSHKTDSLVDSSRFIAELLIAPENSDDIQYWCKKKLDYATVLLDGTVHCSLHYKDASVRGWGTRALWKLLGYLKTADVKQDTLSRWGGFGGILMAGFSLPSPCRPVTALQPAVYLALLEIMLDDIAKPSDGRGRVEPFGREIKNPAAMPVIMRLASSADWTLRRDLVKDFNVLLVKREANFSWILRQPGWPSWLVPLLHRCPKSAENRTEVQKDFLKFAVNLFCMLLQHMFVHKDSVDRGINRLCAQLELQVGWTPPAIAVMRVLLGNVISKVGSSIKQWSDQADSKQWASLFKLCKSVEEFIFYRPAAAVDAAAIELEEAAEVILPIPADLARPTAVQPMVEDSNTVGCVDRSRVGLHLNGSGAAEDVKLAERALGLLDKLGFTGDTASTRVLQFASGKIVKDIVNTGNSYHKAFEEIVRLTKAVTDAATSRSERSADAATAAIGAFLEKRQKQTSGKLFGGSSGNKRQLTQALKSSMQRQQAQQSIRKQVRSRVQRKQAAITVSEDMVADAGESAAAAQQAALTDVQGGVGRRLRGAGAGAGDAGAAAGAGDMEVQAENGVTNDTPCSKCAQPLLSDNGMGTESGVFHERCFCCSDCECSLLDIPYYESKGVLYCKAHYLERFGRSVCAGCIRPFKKGDTAVEACEFLWHLECFKCHNCACLFDADATFYEKDENPFCEDCNTKLFLTCPTCDKLIDEDDTTGVAALGRNYHGECFTCGHCAKTFEGNLFYTATDPGSGLRKAFCEEDYCALFLPKCTGCGESLKEDGLSACGSAWHHDCFKCSVCGGGFGDGQYWEADGMPYCEDDYHSRFTNKCASCGEYVKAEEFIALGKSWHPEHFVCAETGEPLGEAEFYLHENKPYSKEAYKKKFGATCYGCKLVITDKELKACGHSWHPQCLVCSHTQQPIQSEAVMGPDDKIYSRAAYVELFGKRCAWCDESLIGCAPIALRQKSTDAGEERHPECCRCVDPLCPVDLAHQPFKMTPHGALCANHTLHMTVPPCDYCGELISDGKVGLMDLNFHKSCMLCWVTGESLVGAKIFKFEGRPVVQAALDMLAPQCAFCTKTIQGPFVNLQGLPAHSDCVACFVTGDKFTGGQFYMREGMPVNKQYANSLVDLPAGVLDKWKAQSEAAKASLTAKAQFAQKITSRIADVGEKQAAIAATKQRIEAAATDAKRVRGGLLWRDLTVPVPIDPLAGALPTPEVPLPAAGAAEGGASAAGGAPGAASGSEGGGISAPPGPAPKPKQAPGAPPRAPPAPAGQAASPSKAPETPLVHPSDISEQQEDDGYSAADRHGLPEGWARVRSDEGVYFSRIATGESEWTAPEGSAPGAEYWPSGKAGLPLGWVRVPDDEGNTFYRDFVNEAATYDEPSAPAEGAVAAFRGFVV